MAKYKTREGAQRHCHPGQGVRPCDGGGFETYKRPFTDNAAQIRRDREQRFMTHSERLIASLRHHTERERRAMTSIGGRPDYSALRDAGRAIADLEATMTPEEIAAAGAA